MYSLWTQNIKDPEEKVSFEGSILGSKRVLNRLKDLIDAEKNGVEYTEQDHKSFDTPNWQYKTAYFFGYLSALNWIRRLIDLDQQKDIKNDG